MAKVGTGSFDYVSGKKGDTVYCKTKYGTIARKYAKPSKKLTEAQKNENRKFKEIKRAWNSLSDDQHSRWKLNLHDHLMISRHSGKKIKDACHFFQSCNSNLLSINEPMLIDITGVEVPQLIKSFDFEIREVNGKVEIGLYISPNLDEWTKIIIFATRSVSRGKHELSNYDFRQIAVIDKEFISGTSLIDEYLAVFKQSPEEGKRIGFRIKTVRRDCGLADGPYEKQVIFEDSDNQEDINRCS